METPPSFDDGRPSFDHSLANLLLGKYVLVGVTRQDANGTVLTHKQFHGDIITVDPEKGFCIKLRGTRAGEHEWLPPDTRAFFKVKPGEYRLRATSEVVTDPDFATVWTITEPKKD